MGRTYGVFGKKKAWGDVKRGINMTHILKELYYVVLVGKEYSPEKAYEKNKGTGESKHLK